LRRFEENQSRIDQGGVRTAQSFRKVSRGDVISASPVFYQRMENKAGIDNDFGRERVVAEEMPIRGQLKGALSLGDFHDSIQSDFLR
jgi:hypothetical protein